MSCWCRARKHKCGAFDPGFEKMFLGFSNGLSSSLGAWICPKLMGISSPLIQGT